MSLDPSRPADPPRTSVTLHDHQALSQTISTADVKDSWRLQGCDPLDVSLQFPIGSRVTLHDHPSSLESLPRHPVVDGSNFDHFKLSKLPKLLTLKAISTLKALKAQLTTIVEGFKRKLRSPR